jgi:sugar phosphate isomerase/epimerase
MMAGCTTYEAASGGPSFFQRTGRSIGLQLYTLGEDVGTDLAATFARVGEIGYRDIELPNLYGQSPKDIATAAANAGLSISSLHLAVSTQGQAPGLSLASDPAEIADSLSALGAKRAVLPIMIFPDNFRPEKGETVQQAIGRSVHAAGEDLWKRTAALLNDRAAALKPHGIRLGYHNHNMEFAPIGKTTGWDILITECDQNLVDFEVDIGWVATAGRDPVAILEQLKGRVTQLHVKDVGASNTPNYNLTMVPAEIGSGTLDWTKILPAAHAAGVKHFYVEQEPPFAIPRMDAVAKSYAYLAQLRA